MSVGLDIGSKTIKVIELSHDKGRWDLKASGIIGYKGKTPEQAKDDKELTPLVDAIKKLFKEAKIGSREVAISLPEPNVFTRTIRFPLLTDAEISSAVKWEAEQYIPIPKEEAIIQHEIIERREDTTPGQVIVLLVAAPKVLVEKYAKVVEMSGLNLAVVETGLLALVRSLAPENQIVMIVNCGARSTDIAVVKSGNMAFTRSIHTAGEAFTRAIAQALGIQDVQAEEYKRTYGLSEAQLEGKVKGALDPVFNVVGSEMKKALQFYQSEEGKVSVHSVILSGGSAAMPNIAPTLTKLLGIEVVVGNPFTKITVDPQAAKSLSGFAPFYSIAVGLAMRGG
jgi:type IV pilus assembly protein PilM